MLAFASASIARISSRVLTKSSITSQEGRCVVEQASNLRVKKDRMQVVSLVISGLRSAVPCSTLTTLSLTSPQTA